MILSYMVLLDCTILHYNPDHHNDDFIMLCSSKNKLVILFSFDPTVGLSMLMCNSNNINMITFD